MHDPIELLQAYRWGALWRAVQSQAQGGDAIKAFLLSAWWQSPEQALALLAGSRESGPLRTFAETFARMCQGDTAAYVAGVTRLQADHAPAWLSAYLSIEYLGRTSQFDKQAALVRGWLQQGAPDWLWPALFTSLRQKKIDSAPLRKVLAAHPQLPPLGHVLAAWLDIACNQFIPARIRLELLLERCPGFGPAAYELALLRLLLGDATGSLVAADMAARADHMDKGLGSKWLTLSLAHPTGRQSSLERFSFLKAIVPPQDLFHGGMAAYELIHHWIEGDMAALWAIASAHHGYQSLPKSDVDRNKQIFFRYVVNLCVEREQRPELYRSEPSDRVLHVVGESHSLVLANLRFVLGGIAYRGSTHFIMGTKMWHLARPEPDHHRMLFEQTMAALPDEAEVLVVIGEIDCRETEGIWRVVSSKGQPLAVTIQRTVSGFMACVARCAASKHFRRIVIQGVPAPCPAAGEERAKLASAGREYLAMVKAVNEELAQQASAQGWGFWDVYAATVGEDGFSNQRWHLDNRHLKPAFYQNAGVYFSWGT